MPPPPTTAHGALLAHITGGHIATAANTPSSCARSYQPMNVNFGLFPPLTHALKGEHGQRLRGTEKVLAKKRAFTLRALAELARWISGDDRAVAAE
jgi:methylenetetrahydrofolate--tRNA-(uracil-5-)-methyltransferase